MKKLLIYIAGVTALSGCSAASEEKSYPMPVEDVQRILLSTDFAVGVLPKSSGKPRVWRNMGGVIEWTVLDAEKKNGWWCPLSIEPASEDGKSTRVINKCEGLFASERNQQLDELVDAALTDREPKFDQPAG